MGAKWLYCYTFTSPAGLPLEILTLDWWVPGSTTRMELERFKGKQLFAEILTTTPESALAYMKRATMESSLHKVTTDCFNFRVATLS